MTLRRLICVGAPYRLSLITLGVLTIASSSILLVVPWLAGSLLSSVISREPSVERLVALLILALITLTLLNIAVGISTATTSARVLADLRIRIYEHLQQLPLSFHENHRQGDTLALATFEVARLSQFLTGTIAPLPSRLLTAAGAIVLMFQIDGRLALLVPVLVPAFYLVLKIVGRRLRGLAIATQKAEAELLAVAERNLELLPAIKSFTRERIETLNYRKLADRTANLKVEEGRIFAFLEPTISLIAAIGAVILIYGAGHTAGLGAMSATKLFSFLFYAALLTRPVGALANIYGQLQVARGTLDRLDRILAINTEPTNGAHLHRPVRGNILFKQVSFTYPGRESTLHNVNMAVHSGEIVAITGNNGAGKTTLLKLLLRFHDSYTGIIELDGVDISTLSLHYLRQQIGVVPQRALLFNGSIQENIAFGLDGARMEQVEKAARLAQAYEFVAKLPDGFQTQIGDNGVRLSGGQRQRIALARALIKDPPILILDEATSMFDLEGEEAFIDTSLHALQQRTVLIITHRPATLALADRILLIEDGAVREPQVL